MKRGFKSLRELSTNSKIKFLFEKKTILIDFVGLLVSPYFSDIFTQRLHKKQVNYNMLV